MNDWCPDDNLNCFNWSSILLYTVYVCGGVISVKIFDGNEYRPNHSSLNTRVMDDHMA